MSYKGNDLDLRTPDVRPAESGPEPGGDLRLSTLQPFGRHAAIAVDRTVLACCNLAHDIAAFHAAREVGLAHLLHALTRVDAARDILEGHGVGTGELRRDTASPSPRKRRQPLRARRPSPARPPSSSSCCAVQPCGPPRTASRPPSTS